MAILLVLTSAVVGQQRFDRAIYGDLLVVPGERLGALVLGGAIRDEFVKRYGEPDYSWAPWAWPRPNLGRIERWFAQGIALGFCSANKTLYASFAASSADTRPNAFLVNQYVNKLSTPEGLNKITHRITDFYRVYSEPVYRIPDLGTGIGYVFGNGLVIGQAADPTQIWILGAVNPDICDGKKTVGVYVPWVGRAQITRVATSKTGDPEKGTISEPACIPGSGERACTYRKNERVYFLVELGFPPVRVAKDGVRADFEFISPNGDVLSTFQSETQYRLVSFQPGETSKTIVFWLGRDPPRENGEWKVRLYINRLLITTITFLNID